MASGVEDVESTSKCLFGAGPPAGWVVSSIEDVHLCQFVLSTPGDVAKFHCLLVAGGRDISFLTKTTSIAGIHSSLKLRHAPLFKFVEDLSEEGWSTLHSSLVIKVAELIPSDAI